MKKRVLIIGGAGFIGSAVTEFYLKKDYTVTVIDNYLTGRKENIIEFEKLDNFTIIEQDFLEISYDKKQNLIKNTDYIFNFAAIVGIENVLENPFKVLDVNIKIVDQVLEIISLLEKKPTLLTASTSEVYGSQNGELSETKSPALIEDSLKYHSCYAISKLLNENTSSVYFQSKKVPVIILRLFNTIGPKQIGRYGMVVPRFIKSALNNEIIKVHGDGNQTRSFCDVRDTARILFNLAECKEAIGKIVNVGKNNPISIMQLAEKVKKLCNSHSEIETVSFEDYYGDNLKNYANIQHRTPDLHRLHELLDFKHSWSLDNTIIDIAKFISKT